MSDSDIGEIAYIYGNICVEIVHYILYIIIGRKNPAALFACNISVIQA